MENYMKTENGSTGTDEDKFFKSAMILLFITAFSLVINLAQFCILLDIRKTAIDNGLAQYDSKTGNFVWITKRE